jgi:hypothetical protein
LQPVVAPNQYLFYLHCHARSLKRGLAPRRRRIVSRLDDELLEKASVQAGIPRGLVKDVAHETARAFTHTWSQHNPGLPIDDLGRRKIDEQLRLVPLFKEHVVSEKPKRKKS